MNLINQAFQELFNKEIQYKTILKYNKKLGDFNANIKLQNNIVQVNMNYKWQEIDQEIQKGLIQTLLVKMFAKRFKYPAKNTTFNIELYHNFTKRIHLMTPKTKTHPILEASFHRVNQNHFHNLMDQPNLVWGTDSRRKLACYNFHNDTITVSTLFQNTPEILDYLIYHELLHKKQKFHYKSGRTYFHTKKFRQAESLFPNQKQIEKEINLIIKRPRKQSFFKAVLENFK